MFKIIKKKLLAIFCCICRKGKCDNPPKEGNPVVARLEYRQKMFGRRPMEFMRKDYQKAQEAFYLAHEIRRFEIDLYWKRALYFWGFQAAMFIAFAALISRGNLVVAEISITGESPVMERHITIGGIQKKFDLFSPLIAFAGFVMAIAWHYVGRGSKAWQENWESHIDLLEYPFSGNLHKTIIRGDKDFYSVSGINQFISGFVAFIWAVIGIFLLAKTDFIKSIIVNWETLPPLENLYYLFLFVAAFIIYLCISAQKTSRPWGKKSVKISQRDTTVKRDTTAK